MVEPGDGLNVFLYTPGGSYMGISQTTDSQGQAVFNLPEMEYKARADYLSGQYWSAEFNASDEEIVIEEGEAEVQVVQRASALENVPVYVFNESGAYLSMTGQSDADGIVSFRLPAGTYKFRADHQNSQYWVTEPVSAHQVNIINIDTGGGAFSLTLEKAAGAPMPGVPVYVFSSGGAYLGITQQTDENGAVSFDLAEGSYKLRADYLGYKFWTETLDIPTTLSHVMTIPHQDVVITVESLYQTQAEPIEGVRAYLFTESGAYQGIYANTDSQGQAVFSLPVQSYKVRADYLGHQFWSDPFVQSDTSITIDHGRAVLHVTKGGLDVVDAPVYLFTSSGSYLSRSERTDENGTVSFDLPIREYKFRGGGGVDYDGAQQWSDVITLIPHEENSIELDLDLLALDLTNDPNPDRFDGKPPEHRPKGTMVASIGSLYGLLSQTVVGQISREPVYYYINDHLGTPQKMVDESGTVVWAADYMPFGKALVTVNTVKNNFRFAGQYYDSETELHYNYHRHYDPSIGRYLRTDPSQSKQPKGGSVPFLV